MPLLVISLLIYAFYFILFSLLLCNIYVQIISAYSSLLNQDRWSMVGGERGGQRARAHSTWSFWFMYQKTCKYASLRITSPTDDNLPQSALFFPQAGASLLSLPFEMLVRSQACWLPVWFFHVFSFVPKHLPGLRGTIWINLVAQILFQSFLLVALLCESGSLKYIHCLFHSLPSFYMFL